AGKMTDLVVLIQNKYLSFEDIRWQNVECNLDWLERDWSQAVASEESPSPDSQLTDPAAGIQASTEEPQKERPDETAAATTAASEAPSGLSARTSEPSARISGDDRPVAEPEPQVESVSPAEAPDTEGTEEAQELHGLEKDVINRMKADPPRKDARGRQERAYATRLYNKYFRKKGTTLKRIQNIVSAHRETPAAGAPPKKTSRRK